MLCWSSDLTDYSVIAVFFGFTKFIFPFHILEGSVLIFVTRKLNSEELSQNLKKNDFERMFSSTFYHFPKEKCIHGEIRANQLSDHAERQPYYCRPG